MEYEKATGGEHCPLPLMVKTEDECKIASQAVSVRYNKAIRRNNRPAGCYWGNTRSGDRPSYFNRILEPGVIQLDVSHVGGICKKRGKK